MELSVVIPMYNEEENVSILLREVVAALDGARLDYEIVVVDDGSRDGTAGELRRLKADLPRLRVIRHLGNFGQSAGISTGCLQARGTWIATLDGDGQNDPADIPLLYRAALEAGEGGPLLVAGNRRKRNDNWLRRFSSRVANGVRQRLLRDDCPDTGCGLKLFRHEDFMLLPRFDHLHRFLPALFKRAGGRVINVPVNHRPRERGTSKYGVWNRLWVGIVDLAGVMWLQRRPYTVEFREDDAE